MEIYDVVVVGAGPVGLATALGLQKRGIKNILVIDQTRAFRQVGHTVDLLPNGLKALKSLDNQAYEAVKQTGMTFSTPPSTDNQGQKAASNSPEWVYRNLQGEKIRSIPLSFDSWFANYGEGRVSIAWYKLQTALRQLLPPEQVKANHRCISVVEQPEMGWVRVDCVCDVESEENPYAHWQEMTPVKNTDSVSSQSVSKSFRAKLVVGADGINSTVRRVIYQDTLHAAFAKPEYSGFAAIICMGIDNIPQELSTQLEEKYLNGGRIVTIVSGTKDTRMILVRREAGTFGYIIHGAFTWESLQGKSGSALIKLGLKSLKADDFPDFIQELVRMSPEEKMQQRPYYIHRASTSNALQLSSTATPNLSSETEPIEPAWSQGRIVLVGDAAHGMPTFMAQGTNQGFEDALAIATLIANLQINDNQAIATAWKKYSQLRRPSMIYMQQATLNPLIYSSQEDFHSYNQRVYSRDFEPIIEGLL
ncbi:MAG: NAD(P)/FAD-dependent oxidoreductase [Calothrix sp. MO_167.B42]|nr:NAD(P)/FAD-dependent oxidoreductase [Calothrix sp. MO_167.B42]